MKHSLKTGLCFGLASGIITTLGVVVGLNAGTHSRLVVLGGIFTIAVADALSDAFGIHLSEESEGVHTARQVWEATVSTFLSKFAFALTFALPVLFLDLPLAIAVSVAWGFLAIAAASLFIGRGESTKTWKVVAEHLLIAAAVVVATHFVGAWTAAAFG